MGPIIAKNVHLKNGHTQDGQTQIHKDPPKVLVVKPKGPGTLFKKMMMKTVSQALLFTPLPVSFIMKT